MLLCGGRNRRKDFLVENGRDVVFVVRFAILLIDDTCNLIILLVRHFQLKNLLLQIRERRPRFVIVESRQNRLRRAVNLLWVFRGLVN